MKKLGRQKIARKVAKLTVLIVVLSITSQIFVSLFPWVSISESDFVKEELHFNFEMIKKSNDDEIYSLASTINLIILCFWFLIIFGLLSYLGATIHISKKISKLGYMSLALGCFTLIFSILAIYFQFIVIGEIENIDTVSASEITPFFKYYYILLIHSLIIFIFSAIYTRIIISHSITRFFELKEEMKNKTKQKAILFNNIINTEYNQEFKNEDFKEKIASKNDFSKIEMQQKDENEIKVDPKIEEKHKEIEQFLDGKDIDKEKPTIEEKKPETELNEPLIKEESKEIVIKTDEKEIKEEKEAIVFPSEKNKVKPKDSHEPTVSESFEKALSSAIQKKHATEDKSEIPKEAAKESKKEVQSKKTKKDKKDSA
jgi:hypothetical protein